MIQSMAYFVASGDAFFFGALLIVVGHAASWRFRLRRYSKLLRLLTVLGVVLCLAAVVPLPLWLYATCLGLPIAWINLPYGNPETAWRYQQLRRLQPLVEVLLLIAMSWELWERTALSARSMLSVVDRGDLPREIHVVGDGDLLYMHLEDVATAIPSPPIHRHVAINPAGAP